ncbi:MAG: hypothetical protein JO352_36240 [Chloroflexi bacterium]|nr:hypothetical protein [Chloroflexota bacterium]MBV9602289.1 hypothetical protein [Chloroflexota bacterium]
MTDTALASLSSDRSRATLRNTFGPSTAALIVGLTGGSDDEWWRLQRNWRVAWMGGRLMLFAARLVFPLIAVGIMRRWAFGRLER